MDVLKTAEAPAAPSLRERDQIPDRFKWDLTKIYSDLPKLPQTEAVVKEILSLPIYGELPLEDVDYVCDAILEFSDKE